VSNAKKHWFQFEVNSIARPGKAKMIVFTPSIGVITLS
jgi:hypothetical protein